MAAAPFSSSKLEERLSPDDRAPCAAAEEADKDTEVSVTHTLVTVEVEQGRWHRLVESAGSSDSNSSEAYSSLVRNRTTRHNGPPTLGENNTVCFILWKTLLFVLLLGLTTSLLMIGLTSLNECNAIDDLPSFLLTTAVALGLRLLVLLWQWLIDSECGRCRQYSGTHARHLALFAHALEMFIVVLFVIESQKLYRRYSKVQFDDPSAQTYCEPRLFRFSFWLFTLLYCGLAGLVLGGLCAVALFVLFQWCLDSCFVRE